MGGVHGGSMGRSVSRFSMLVGSAVAVGSLIAGCASNAPGGAVIGVPPAQTSRKAFNRSLGGVCLSRYPLAPAIKALKMESATLPADGRIRGAPGFDLGPRA